MIAIALIFFCVIYGCYVYIFKTRKDNPKKCLNFPGGHQHRQHIDTVNALVDRASKLEYERVSIKSFDGVNLSAKLYFNDVSKPIVIAFHGYHGKDTRDFCGGIDACIDNDLNILLATQRAHGDSDGKTITFGVKEKRDCADWVKYINSRFSDVKIILAGVSMGATTVLCSLDCNLPKNVVGIIADCPFTSPFEIVKKVCCDRRLPSKILMPFISLSAKIFGDFDIKGANACQSVEKSQFPILLIHGTIDSFVPHSMSEEIYKSNPDKITFVSIDGAEHAASYLIDKKRYVDELERFVEKII